ncbi:PAS domain S-box protein [Granulicella sibirica]|nr:PAS domain-containing sensor histidine kinase [Granulicella sibirica]
MIRSARVMENRYRSAVDELHRIRRIFDSVPVGISIADATLPDEPLVYVNSAFEKMTGYRAAEVYGRNCRFLQGSLRGQTGALEIREAIAEKRETRALLKNYRKDGISFWNDVLLSPFFDTSGQLTHFVGIQNDVTQEVDAKASLKHMERDLEETQLQLQAILDTMHDAVVVLDRGQNIVKMNESAARFLGLSERTLSSKNVEDTFEAYLPDGSLLPRDEWPSALALKGHFVQDSGIVIVRKDTGKSILAEVSTAPILNQAGEPYLVTVYYRDVTEQSDIVRAHTRLAAIVESSDDAIISKDLHGLVTSWNSGAEKIFGYTAGEILGQSIRLVIPADLQREEDEILEGIRRGDTVEHIETRRRTKSGDIIHLSLTISPIRDANGKVIGASKIGRDITERRRLESQLHQSQKLEAVGQLTGGVAHDFNNLLGVIVGNLDLLERLVPDNAGALKRVRTAQKAAERGADLTRRLLAFSRRDELRPTPASLNESVHNVIALSARLIGPEIKIKSHLDPSLPAIFVDAAALESALLNLFLNARDAMPNGGSLNIMSELRQVRASSIPVQAGDLQAGSYAGISISDTGSGMSKEVLERAFEPFFTTKKRDQGTGLGLAMVYGFVKQSGGTIRIYSEPGFGTTVTFFLPLAETIPEPVVVPTRLAKRNSVGVVLVVDDELDLLEIAAAYLDGMECTHFEAVDGASALERIALHPEIELVVTDVIMPGGMNGFELAEKILQVRPEMKIIYCSGFPEDALAERRSPLMGAPVLRKPYQHVEFEEAVREAFAREEPA